MGSKVLSTRTDPKQTKNISAGSRMLCHLMSNHAWKRGEHTCQYSGRSVYMSVGKAWVWRHETKHEVPGNDSMVSGPELSFLFFFCHFLVSSHYSGCDSCDTIVSTEFVQRQTDEVKPIPASLKWDPIIPKVSFIVFIQLNLPKTGQQSTKIINRMWGNNSYYVMTSMYCAAEISTELSVLTS